MKTIVSTLTVLVTLFITSCSSNEDPTGVIKKENITSEKKSNIKTNAEIEIENHVSTFIDYFKKQEIEKLASNIDYPLLRGHILKPIKNKEEFLIRYTQVFDDSLVKVIINSDINRDWKVIGMKGIALKIPGDNSYGLIWMDQYSGGLIAVNYKSKIAIQREKEILDSLKSVLHESVKDFTNHLLTMETAKFRIRLDYVKYGTDDANLRYASWPLKSKLRDKPDLILYNGKESLSPNQVGNNIYTFTNDDFNYVCTVLYTQEPSDTTEGFSLSINKKGKEILFQRAVILEENMYLSNLRH